ncbi:MAG: 4-hydroxy-3-methylbut-2-enyl diphosphate reductase [Acholeplasmatales bacterium]|nr:4-hydroxy-3-methylbut-2-enyl diphosphate reductase [Acholeplasmatales bacterium]
MKINRIEPQGFCGGVKNALRILDEALSDNTVPRPIYLLGAIIHNNHVINECKEKGIIIIDDKNKTRLELLDQINSGTVIFSAHGVSPSVYEKAQSKGLYSIDATCPNVKIIHNKISKYLSEGYDSIYIGSKDHAEYEGVSGISSDIHLVSNIDDINKLDINNDKIYITNQTTLSTLDIKDLFDSLINKYPNAIIDDKICNATTVRQKAVLNQEHVDLCIVVGDKTSSNTNKLLSTAKKANINAVLCDNLDDLDKSLLKDINSVSVTSGASTPSYLVDEIIEYLKIHTN